MDHALLKKKAPNPRQYRPDPAFFLSNVVVSFADDIPSGDRDVIIGGILAMGGQYSQLLTKLVTHVIALSMDSHPCKTVLEKTPWCNIVLPHWFDTCFKLGKKIDPAPYKLPDPAILRLNEETTPVRAKSKYEAHLKGASKIDPDYQDPGSPSKERRELSVFRNHAILLSNDLKLSPHLERSLIEIVRMGGGEVVDKVKEADIMVCQHRECPDFLSAMNDRIDVGNINWLYHLISSNKWISPTKRLLHFPIPKGGIPGFRDFQISISNYTGEARIYLENLIRAAGSTFTKTMTQENTHLITAHTLSEKVDAAREWNIAMVNHLWLEESYAQYKVLSLANEKYITFPSKTNLGEVIGQTEVDRGMLEDLYVDTRPGAEEYKDTSWKPNILNSSALRTPGKEGLNPNEYRTPSGSSGKENQTPNSRNAKDSALFKLHKMAPDIALYEKESKRVGGVIYGGRKVTDPERINLAVHSKGRKRTSDDVEASSREDDERHATSEGPQKRRKKEHIHQSIKLRFVVTSGPHLGWTPEKSTELRKVGIEEADDFSSSDHVDVLVAPKILRTLNFFAAVANGIPIVHEGWLKEVLGKRKPVPTDDFNLRDQENEKRYHFNLQSALSKAREHQGAKGLFNGNPIFCTANVDSGFDNLAKIIKTNQGVLQEYRGREARPLSRKSDFGGSMQNCLFLVSHTSDRELWPKFKSMAEKSECRPMLVTQDWVYGTALSQNIEQMEEAWLLEE